MKITRNTTVEQLKEALKVNVGAVKEKDNDLFSQIAYADKSIKEGKDVPKKDLADLVKSVMKCLGDSFTEPTFEEKKVDETPSPENSIKKGGKLKSKTKKGDTPETKTPESDTKDGDSDKAEREEKKEETPKAEKKSAKKSQSKKGLVVSVLENKETGDFNVTEFAKEFTDSEGVKYTRADDITSMEDLLKEDLENVVFALYWNKKQLKKFGYMGSVSTIAQPKEFPNDVDLASCMWVSEENVVTYAISLYTEALYALTPDDFESVEGVRYLGDIEYQIYRVVK